MWGLPPRRMRGATREGSLWRRDFSVLPRPSFGAWGLSPLGESLPDLSFVFLALPGGGFDSAGAWPFGYALSSAPLPCGGKDRRDRVPRLRIWRMAFSASGGRPPALDGFPVSGGSSHRPLFLPGLPGGGGFPPGCCPRRLFASWLTRLFRQDLFSSVLGGSFSFPAKRFAEARSLLLADVPFPRLSAAPVFPSSWPPGSFFGGGFPYPWQGALTTVSSQPLSRWFRGGSPVLRFTAGRSVPG